MPVEKIKILHNNDIALAEKPIPPEVEPIIDRSGNADMGLVEIDTGEGCIERFLAKARKFRNYPPAQCYYHAFGNQRGNWTVEKVRILMDYAREHGMEIRAWGNLESAINLIVLKDPDTSEDSGMEIYEKMQGNFDSYGLASWYEFEQWGIPLPLDDDVIIERTPIIPTGIKIGKGDDWVLIS